MYSPEEFARRFKLAMNAVAGEGFTLKYKQDPDTIRTSNIRMSGLGGCARRQYYDSVVTMELGEPQGTPWAPILGYAGQEIVSATLGAMGYEVFDEEAEVTFAGILGHMDGALRGADLDDEVVWDSKIRNTFAMRRLILGGPDPQMNMQFQMYMAASGRELTLCTVLPFDATDMRVRMLQYKMEGYDPQIYRMLVPRDEAAVRLGEDRIGMLNFAIEAGLIPMREFDPIKNEFPCSWCPFQGLCLMDGDTDFVVTPLPKEWTDGKS